ncbi:putative protein TPRXL [Apis dorsata]|uniref:putative protein TPRXL n=1 Tax=Apis dorsata TaxID=7462 RepID=UPI0012939A98|nr:putative protein TPRXL [Apis dorsata]
MNGNTDPPSDVTAMDSENNKRSKTQRNSNDMTNTASSGTTTSSATYSTTQSDQPREYCSQRSIRAGSASPLPTNSSSLSSSSSSLSSSSSTPPLQPGCTIASYFSLLISYYPLHALRHLKEQNQKNLANNLC